MNNNVLLLSVPQLTFYARLCLKFNVPRFWLFEYISARPHLLYSLFNFLHLWLSVFTHVGACAPNRNGYLFIWRGFCLHRLVLCVLYMLFRNSENFWFYYKIIGLINIKTVGCLTGHKILFDMIYRKLNGLAANEFIHLMVLVIHVLIPKEKMWKYGNSACTKNVRFHRHIMARCRT